MLKNTCLLILIVVLSACSSIKKHYVQFGEHSPDAFNGTDSIKLFYDRYGSLYPEVELSNTAIRGSYSSLYEYFKKDEEVFGKVLAKYALSETEGYEENFYLLQETIAEKVVNEINQREYDEITVLIHGYRNSPDYAGASYSNLKNIIKRDYPAKHLFVEIYWDGLIYTHFNMIKAWDNAQAHSYLVGVELRKVLSKLNATKLNVITHSTGANVISSALFNQTSKMSKKDRREFKDFYISKLEDERYLTPTIKDIRVAMFAPAMPGVSTFVDYSERNTDYDFNGQDNYSFYITFNENDPALTKKRVLGEAGIKWVLGSTSLGSLKEEAERVSQEFNENAKLSSLNHPKFFDFSYTENGMKQTIHALYAYLDNGKAKKILSGLYAVE